MIRQMFHRLMAFAGLAASTTSLHSNVGGVRLRRDTSLPRQARKRSGHYGKMRLFRSYAARP